VKTMIIWIQIILNKPVVVVVIDIVFFVVSVGESKNSIYVMYVCYDKSLYSPHVFFTIENFCTRKTPESATNILPYTSNAIL